MDISPEDLEELKATMLDPSTQSRQFDEYLRRVRLLEE